MTVTNGKIQNVSLVTETERSINDVLGFSALITLVKPDNTTSIAACVNLIPHTSDLRIWTALFKGPNVVGNVYFLQLHSTVRMIQFLNNANRGVNVEPLDWALVGQWDKQADSYDNPDRCDGNALRERQQASLYNNTDDTEGIRIVGNPNVIPINFDMTSLPEESEFGNGTVLVLSEVPRFSVSKEVLAVGCATVLQLASMVATAEFNNSVNGDLRFYQVSPFHLLQAKLSPLVRQNVSRSQTGRLRFSVLSFPLFMDEPKRVVGLQSQCDLNYLGSPYPPLGNDNSSASFFTLEPQMESVEHLMWIGGFSLFGQRAIVWRSIAINDNIDEWPVDCTTVRPSNRVIFAEAIFHYPVAGRILFAQEYNRPLAATTIQVVLNHMFFNDFTESQWHLYPGKVKEDLDSLVCTNVFGRVLNPDAMDARNCENHLGQNCPMGFLSEKFGPIVINPYEQLINSSVPRSQLLLTDFDLKLIGTNKITEAVVFLDWKWAKACANITIKSPTTARYFVKIGEIIRPVSLEEQYGKKEFLSQSNEDLKDLVFAKPLEGGYKETCDAKELGDPIKVELSQDVIGKSVAFNTSEPGRFQDCSRVDFSPIIDVRSRYGLARIETASLQGYIRFVRASDH